MKLQAVDCDDVMLALANRDRTPLTDVEQRAFHLHLDECEECRALAVDTTTDWRWIARLPEDAFEDPTALVLPTVDPVVFDIDMEIAAGGMGRITKATDRRLGRDVALKEVLEPNMRARFEREAVITARLQHPAIVPIYEAGTFPNGSAFYTMRLVWGGTLGAAIHRTKTMAARLALLPHVLAVIDALAYAHNNQIIHRDLKPGNVLIGEFGETVVIDWGLAKELGASDGGDPGAPSRPSAANLTRVGAVLGTPGFMSPEQASGGTIDERADVYALGAILYNLLAGVPPYFDKHEKDGSTQIIAIGLSRPPTPIGELAPDAPADLRMICEKAMARAKEDRYRSAAEMAKELRNFQAGRLIAREYSTRELVARWISKHRAPVAIGSFAALALAIVAVVAFVNITRSRDEAETATAKAQAEEKEAQQEKKAAQDNFAALLEEQGLRELLAGDSSRALTYLAEASKRGRDSTALRYMIASASHDLDLQQHEFPARAIALAYDLDGRMLAIEAGELVIRDGARVVTSRRLGSTTIEAAWFDPSGRHVLVRNPGDFAMWDIAGDKIAWTEPVTNNANRVAFGGARVAISQANAVTVRDAATGTLIATLDAGDALDDLLVDDDMVAGCRSDTKLRVWPKVPGPARTRDGAACTLLARLEPGVLAVATARFELLRWPVESETPVATMSGHIAINTIAVDRTHQRIATGDATGVVMWKWDGKALGESRDVQGGITKLAWAPDGSFLVGSGDDHRLLIWDSDSFHLRQSITPGTSSIDAIAIARDGKRITATGSQGSRVWSVPVGRLTQQTQARRAAASDATWIVDDAIGALTVRSLETGAEVSRLPEKETMVEMAMGDGRLTTLTLDNAVASREVSGGTAGTRTLLDGRPALTPGNPHVAVVARKTGARLLDARTGDALDIKTDGAPIAVEIEGRRDLGVDVSPNGSVIAIATSRSVTLYRGDGSVIAKVGELDPDHGKLPRFDPTGGLLVLVGGNSNAWVVDGQTGAKLYELPNTRWAGAHVAFSHRSAALRDPKHGSHNSPRVALAVTNTVFMFELDRSHARALGHVSSTIASSFALSDEGSLLATGSVDGSIRITDDQGRLLDRLVGSQRNIERVEFVGDDSRLIGISSGDRNIIPARVSLWDVHIDLRASDEIDRFAAAHSDWKLNGVLLEPAR